MLDHGEKIAEGKPAEVRAEPARHRGLPRQEGVGGARTDGASSKSTTSRPTTATSRRSRASALEVNEGECVTLIGSNGAGKSTTLRSISGPHAAARGLDPAGGRRDRAPAAAGDRPPGHLPVARGPQVLPAHDRAREPRARARSCAATAPDRRRTSTRVFELFPRLDERQAQKAGTMSGGEQQMLAIGRALMGSPQILLLDEPSMGISPILTERIYETIAEINKQGTTILLVEQNANFALEVSQRAYVLETGKVVDVRRLRLAADQPRSPEGLPRHMIGATRLWLMYAWLLAAIVASYLSGRKGYSEKSGPRVRPAAARHRRDHLACDPGQGALEVEDGRAVRAPQGRGRRAARGRRGRRHDGRRRRRPAAAPPRPSLVDRRGAGRARPASRPSCPARRTAAPRRTSRRAAGRTRPAGRPRRADGERERARPVGWVQARPGANAASASAAGRAPRRRRRGRAARSRGGRRAAVAAASCVAEAGEVGGQRVVHRLSLWPEAARVSTARTAGQSEPSAARSASSSSGCAVARSRARACAAGTAFWPLVTISAISP